MPSTNPFGALTPAEIAGLYEWPETAITFLRAPTGCLHVQGAPGSGKTTLLKQLQLIMERRQVSVSYIYVPLGGAGSTTLTAVRDCTLVDEADRLPPRALAFFLAGASAAARKVVLGTHRNLLGAVRRAGLDAYHLTLRPLRGPADVAAFLELRVQHAGLNGASPRFTPDAIQAFWRLGRGNPRSTLELAYEVYEDSTPSGPLTRAQVQAAHISVSRQRRSEDEAAR